MTPFIEKMEAKITTHLRHSYNLGIKGIWQTKSFTQHSLVAFILYPENCSEIPKSLGPVFGYDPVSLTIKIILTLQSSRSIDSIHLLLQMENVGLETLLEIKSRAFAC